MLGTPDSPFQNGYIHGKLLLDNDYPMKPPQIQFLSKSGRYEINTDICTSFSSYHPESWNPNWTIENIILGLRSTLTEKADGIGGINSSNETIQQLMEESKQYKCKICGIDHSQLHLQEEDYVNSQKTQEQQLKNDDQSRDEQVKQKEENQQQQIEKIQNTVEQQPKLIKIQPQYEQIETKKQGMISQEDLLYYSFLAQKYSNRMCFQIQKNKQQNASKLSFKGPIDNIILQIIQKLDNINISQIISKIQNQDIIKIMDNIRNIDSLHVPFLLNLNNSKLKNINMLNINEDQNYCENINKLEQMPKQILCTSQQLNDLVDIDHDISIILNDQQKINIQQNSQKIPYKMIKFQEQNSQYNIQNFITQSIQICNLNPKLLSFLNNIQSTFINISLDQPQQSYQIINIPKAEYLKVTGNQFNCIFMTQNLKKLKITKGSFITKSQLHNILLNNKNLEYIEIDLKGELPIDDRIVLNKLQYLKINSIEDMKYTLTLKNILQFYKYTPNLQVLICKFNISCTDQQIINIIEKLTTLETLQIEQLYIRTSHHQYQKKVDLVYGTNKVFQLKNLSLKNCQVSDKFIEYLQVSGLLNQLISIEFDNIDNITDKGFLENFTSIQQQYKLMYKSPQLNCNQQSDYGAVFQLREDGNNEYIVPDTYNTEQNCTQLQYLKIINCNNVEQIEFILAQSTVKVVVTDILMHSCLVDWVYEQNETTEFIFPKAYQFSEQQLLHPHIIFE